MKKLRSSVAAMLKVMIYGRPRKCMIFMDKNGKPLERTRIRCTYPINLYRDEARYHEWKVFARTVDPDFRYDQHAAWMLHIMGERMLSAAMVAEAEHNEMQANVNKFKTNGRFNFATTNVNVGHDHEN